jgi:hypothetical protein
LQERVADGVGGWADAAAGEITPTAVVRTPTWKMDLRIIPRPCGTIRAEAGTCSVDLA